MWSSIEDRERSVGIANTETARRRAFVTRGFVLESVQKQIDNSDCPEGGESMKRPRPRIVAACGHIDWNASNF
jgi:hypothetical protein